jgi:hypothetical protein
MPPAARAGRRFGGSVRLSWPGVRARRRERGGTRYAQAGAAAARRARPRLPRTRNAKEGQTRHAARPERPPARGCALKSPHGHPHPQRSAPWIQTAPTLRSTRAAASRRSRQVHAAARARRAPQSPPGNASVAAAAASRVKAAGGSLRTLLSIAAADRLACGRVPVKGAPAAGARPPHSRARGQTGPPACTRRPPWPPRCPPRASCGDAAGRSLTRITRAAGIGASPQPSARACALRARPFRF